MNEDKIKLIYNVDDSDMMIIQKNQFGISCCMNRSRHYTNKYEPIYQSRKKKASDQIIDKTLEQNKTQKSNTY